MSVAATGICMSSASSLSSFQPAEASTPPPA